MVKNRWNTWLRIAVFLIYAAFLCGCEKNDLKGFKTPRIKKVQLMYEIDEVPFTITIADFYYLKSGKPEKIICYEGSSIIEYEIIYNILGNPDSLNIRYENVYDENYTRRFCFIYDDILTLSRIEETANSENKEELMSIVFEYDDLGRIIRSYSQEIDCYEEYTYNNDDNIMELTVYDDGEPDPYKSAIYSFDSNPNPFDNNCPFLNHFVNIGILNGVSYQATYFINKNNITALTNTSGDYNTFYQFNYTYQDNEYPVEVEVSVSENPIYTYLFQYY